MVKERKRQMKKNIQDMSDNTDIGQLFILYTKNNGGKKQKILLD